MEPAHRTCSLRLSHVYYLTTRLPICLPTCLPTYLSCVVAMAFLRFVLVHLLHLCVHVIYYIYIHIYSIARHVFARMTRVHACRLALCMTLFLSLFLFFMHTRVGSDIPGLIVRPLTGRGTSLA